MNFKQLIDKLLHRYVYRNSGVVAVKIGRITFVKGELYEHNILSQLSF